MRYIVTALFTAAIFTSLNSAQANNKVLRLLTWEGHAPESVIKLFTKKTGIQVRVTYSNNVDMVARLRANTGANFDLAQPGQDQIVGSQAEFNLYKPIDLTKINTRLFISSMLRMTKKYTTLNNRVYGLPHVWGTSGLLLNNKKATKIRDYTDLCRRKIKGRVAYRLQRPTLIAFAFSMGLDPFAAYNNKAKYQTILDTVANKLLSCHSNINRYWNSGEDLLNLLRSGKVVAAMAWDTGGWQLNREKSKFNFLAPKSGALGWMDTFALPRNGHADKAAYQWINFVMQAKIAAMITAASGNFTASLGADAYIGRAQKKQLQNSFPGNTLEQIHWYPPMPIGLQTIENKILEKIKAGISRQKAQKTDSK